MPRTAFLLEKYGGPAPRYTSYPTAPNFGPEVTPQTVEGWLRGLDTDSASIYIHLPFCKSLCLYCGCNMKVTNTPATISRYVDTLAREIAQTARLLPRRLKVTALHLGGGTPSYCPAADMLRLFAALREHFDLAPDAEISMEIDPRRMDDEFISILPQLGLTRASLGIQDTDPAVQQAIRRVQPHALNLRAVEELRRAGAAGVNLDLLYGLPLQTPETMRKTVEDILQLKPDRVALFGYAHVPWMKKHQTVLEPYGLPNPAQRLALFNTASKALTDAGYALVGIDHFCLPDDSMAKAARARTLHRNFMGYTTDGMPVLLGFGASAISQYPQGYAQNVTAPADYMDAVATGMPPVARGIAVSPEDALRRDIIESLLCTMRVNIGHMLASHGLSAEIMSGSFARLGLAMLDGLVERGEDLHSFVITPAGRPYARAIAACFDTYLDKKPGRHSRAV